MTHGWGHTDLNGFLMALRNYPVHMVGPPVDSLVVLCNEEITWVETRLFLGAPSVVFEPK